VSTSSSAPWPTPRSQPAADRLVELFDAWNREASEVPLEWSRIFESLDGEARSWLEARPRSAGAAAPAPPAPAHEGREAILDSLRALMLIRAYRGRGHLEARLDPLGLAPIVSHADLDPSSYGFTEADFDRPIFINGELGLDSANLREIIAVLRRDYCGTIGLEFRHLQDPEQQDWVQARMEGVHHNSTIKKEGKLAILERLTAAETFERFLDRKYTGTKRFGLDGAEAAIPALEQVVRRAAELGTEEIVIGMSHRGRLNVLANLMGKPLPAIFSEFQGGAAHPEDVGGSGDVKYHLGTSSDRVVEGRPMHLSLVPNPSHLEAVDPVVVGKVRARQDQMGDDCRLRCMGLLLHGDAAFAGQGLVPETLQFCDLAGYRTGGVVHLIINNQIGFTTNPSASRSSPYCSDVAKMIQAPIVHVNGDDPEAVVEAAAFAVGFRNQFNCDVVIDMVCYRRHGHNEGDEPSFTQPIMYAKIASHPSVREIYANRLIEEGVISAADVERSVAEWMETLATGFEAAASYKADKADWLEGAWSGLERLRGYQARRGHTEVSIDTLQEVGRALVKVPEGFRLNRKIGRILKAKQKMFDTGEGIDWSTAEALAFGSLLSEGSPVRLSGEDCNRGTFSHRHASWIDQEDETRYVPLDHVREPQEQIEIRDSPLSEFGVLGFEYGYAMAQPRALVLWEAQFGDFVNGAQVVIDQFIAAGESKWLRMSGLVLLLPHGFEGQGPEHSSARLERFLQLCAEDNLQVVNCTTPANYFHVLRRQMHREIRKPLIVMAPKSLLRHKRVVSRLADMGPGSHFHRVMYCDEIPCEAADARQVVLCTGKVYYDLVEEREKRGVRDVHFLRLEQIYPFPSDALGELLAPYTHCHLVWCQEEPRNMGAWNFVSRMLDEVTLEIGCKHPMVRYAGRRTSASPATGLASQHRAQQEALVDSALKVGVEALGRLAAARQRT
jgi:2-oxoglutarate dehydrogenase E1 component